MNRLLNKFLSQLFKDNTRVELRVFGPLGNKTGVFDDQFKLIDTAMALPETYNSYITVNRIDRPVTNTLTTATKGGSTSNKDVTRISRMVFDIDSVHPKGVMASGSEVNGAIAAGVKVERYLRLMDFPEPVKIFSGNGIHLYYRCDLPADETTKKQFQTIYRQMKKMFDTDDAIFDSSVLSPGQIMRLPGSFNRKGEDTFDRPHRPCYITPFDTCQRVDSQIITRLFKNLTPVKLVSTPKPYKPQKGGADFKTIDVVQWFADHGHYLHHIEGNIHAAICPWSAEHSEKSHNDTVIFERDERGAGFHCKHSHCVDRNLWQVIQLWGDASDYCDQGDFNGAA